jgi:hypothetical protein
MNPTSAAPQVNLQQIDQYSEIIIRAGNLHVANAAQHLIERYEIDQQYNPPIYGLSTVFRQGARVTELANAAAYPNKSLSVSIINALVRELAVVKHKLILYITPDPRLPDHHTLAVAQNGVPQQTLLPHVADALIKAFIVVDNPYKKP